MPYHVIYTCIPLPGVSTFSQAKSSMCEFMSPLTKEGIFHMPGQGITWRPVSMATSSVKASWYGIGPPSQ